MVLVFDSVDVDSSSSNTSKHEVLEKHLDKVGEMSKEELMSLPRVVEKDGTMNMINKPGWIWFNPFDFSNLLEMKWFSFILIFAIIYGVTFITFGALFHLLNYSHDVYKDGKSHEDKCYVGVGNLTTAFLFAMETSQTIGYGSRYPDSKCPDGIMLLLLNIFWATFLSTLFSGIFLAKFASISKSGVIRFSTSALITKRNGSLFLMFRVADPVESGMDYGAEATAICVNYQAKEYEEKTQFNFMHVQHISVGFQIDGTNNQIPLLWPIVVSHRIDKHSPLYRMDPARLKASKIEIIVTMRGFRSESGGSIDSMTSYTSKKIVWGARFCPESVFDRRGGVNMASFSQKDIDKYVRDNTAKLSAEEVDMIKEES